VEGGEITVHSFAISRLNAPEVCYEISALFIKGAGNAGRPMRPRAACAKVESKEHTRCQVTPESPGIPHAMVLRLMSYSPRRSGFVVTVAPKKLAS
jgi:hypothetical protein